MHYILILIALILVTGCDRRLYQKKMDRPDMAKLTDSVFVLDSTYGMYVRKVFKQATTKSDTAKREEMPGNSVAQNSDTIMSHRRRTDTTRYQSVKTNHSDIDRQNDTGLIEVEYLLYSDVHKRCIYLGTIPDKYERYYGTHYYGDSIINIYDLRLFFFGKVSRKSATKQLGRYEREVAFKCKKHGRTDVWTIDGVRRNSPLITIDLVKEMKNGYLYDIYSIEHALADQVAFKRVPGYRFVYKAKNRPMLDVSEKKIYLRKVKKGYSVYFSLANGEELFFKSGRTIYLPF